MGCTVELRLPVAYVVDLHPEAGVPGVRVHLLGLGGVLVFRSPDGSVLEEVPSQEVVRLPVHLPLGDGPDGAAVLGDLRRWQVDGSTLSALVERSPGLEEGTPYSRVVLEDASASWSVSLA